MSTDNLAVDVVIPVRNSARFIAPCLHSVKAQTRAPQTVIVVDDGSTDETPHILEKYAQQWANLHVVPSPARGVSHARNLALAHVTAPLVAFLDSDDVWEPEKLERQVALFTSNELDPGFVHCSYHHIDDSGKRVLENLVVPPRKRGDIFAELLNGYVLSGSASAVVARSGLLHDIGGFDERLFHGEDWDVWLKLARISRIDFVPDALVAIRVHAASSQRRDVSADSEAFLFQRLIVLDKWADRASDDGKIVKSLQFNAVAANVTNVRYNGLRFGLYRRLQTSDIALARRIFSDFRSYLWVHVLWLICNSWKKIRRAASGILRAGFALGQTYGQR